MRCFHEAYCGCPGRVVFRIGAFVTCGPVTPAPQNTGRINSKDIVMAFELQDTHQVSLSVAFKDAHGHDARVDGIPEWLVDNPAVLQLSPGPTGMDCLVQPLGPLGNAKVSVKADADLGNGMKPIIGVLDITVTGGEAVLVEITPGQPTPLPTP